MPAAVLADPKGGTSLSEGGASASSPSDLEGRIEIVLSSGIVVRVGAAVDQGALCRVLAALSER
jgi:hypothetical protein